VGVYRSILVKTLEWKKLKPNMPWLVDAAACVLLDIFVSFGNIALQSCVKHNKFTDLSNGRIDYSIPLQQFLMP